MSKTQINNLIAQINELLNRPLGSAARVSSLDVIQQRDRLKHLRYRLENPRDERDIGGLIWECNLAIAQTRSQYKQPQFGTPLSMQFLKAIDRRSSTLLQPLSAPTKSNWTKDIGPATPKVPEPASGSNEQIATLVGQTVRQTIEQTLAVERSRTIAEIDANLRSLLESQKHSQLSSDLQDLEYQKRVLSQEISRLESERQVQLEQLSHQQQHQQETIASSLQLLNQQLRDRLQSEITEAFSDIRSAAVVDTEASQQELTEKVRQQTDRFLATLDAMFSNTFQSLEQQTQAYRASLSLQLEQMQGMEQQGELLLGTLVDRIKTEVGEPSVLALALESEMLEADLSPVTENSEDTDWYSAIRSLFDLPIEPANLLNGIEDESIAHSETSEAISRNGAAQVFSSVDDLEADFNSFLQELEGSLDDSEQATSEQATKDPNEVVLSDNFAQGDRMIEEPEMTALSQDLETVVAEASEIIGNAANPWMVAYGCLIVMSLATAIERSAEPSESEVEAIALESLEIIEDADIVDTEELLTDPSLSEIISESHPNPSISDLSELSEGKPERSGHQPETFTASEREETIHSTNGSSNGYGTAKEQSLIEFVEIHSQKGLYAQGDRFADITDTSNPDEAPFVSEEEVRLTEFADLEDLQVTPENVAQNDESQDSDILAENIEGNTEDGDRDSAATPKDIIENSAKIDTLPSLERKAEEDFTDSALEAVAPELKDRAEVFEEAIAYGTDITPLSAPPKPVEPAPAYSLSDTWFLGIDFGGAYLRASLFNACTHVIYPLVFQDGITAIPCYSVFPNDPETSDSVRVGSASKSENNEPNDLNIVRFKHLLKLGLPYCGSNAWQPVVQWSRHQQIPLKHFVEMLKELSLCVKTTAIHPQLPDAREILENLSGVILGHPTEWSDTYVLNLREAISSAGLVKQAEQIVVIEQAIAPLLNLIHTNHGPQKPTLILDAGATTTSLLVVRASRGDIGRSNINSRSVDCAGFSIDQDIVTQLLIPRWQQTANAQLDVCDLDGLDAPTTGEPDPVRRALLQQYLLSSTAGKQLLNLAEQLKIDLSQHPDREQWTGEVGGQSLVVTRRELESQVLQPFIQRINRELNILLSNCGVSAEDIGTVFLIGGTMATPSISRWLSQKLPNTSIDSLPSSSDADGLAIAPLYPYLLNIARQQYSDYFLLQEICGLNLQSPVNPNRLVQQLQNRGINAKACRDRILTLLQGDLPSGLFPWQEPEKGIFLPDPEISAEMFAGRLFELDSDGSYRPNLKKFQLLRSYLQSILDNMHQTLNEPLVFPEFATASSQL